MCVLLVAALAVSQRQNDRTSGASILGRIWVLKPSALYMTKVVLWSPAAQCTCSAFVGYVPFPRFFIPSLALASKLYWSGHG